MVTPAEQAEAQRTLFYGSMGRELRLLREASGLSLEAVAERLDHGRDWLSKTERGLITLSLYDYVRLVTLFADFAPGHPALELARRLMPGVRRLPRKPEAK